MMLDWAMDSAEKQAGHSSTQEIIKLKIFHSICKHHQLFSCPYDAELFGHWWYEGPYWIYIYFKKYIMIIAILNLITPGEYIDKFLKCKVSTPCRSSWGAVKWL